MNFKDINEILRDASKRMKFKDITSEEDVILLIFEDELWWAVITKIGDENEFGIREVFIKLLAIPPLEIHFHITNDQLDGNKSFKIESNDVFMKSVDFTGSYIPEDIKEIYRKNIEKDEEDNNMKVFGNTSVN